MQSSGNAARNADYALPVDDEWAALGRHRTATSGASVPPAVLCLSRPNACLPHPRSWRLPGPQWAP